MCTRIRFLGWAPGSRVPSQAPTISGPPAAIMGSGMIANPGISVNPNQSPNDNARYLFMVDLLIELAAEIGEKSVRHYPFPMPLSNHRNCRVPAARLRHANSARVPFMASWLPQAYTRLWPASAVAGLQERKRPQGVHTDRPCPLLREHAAVLLHKPELTRGYQRPYRRLSGHGPETAFEETSVGMAVYTSTVLGVSRQSDPQLPTSEWSVDRSAPLGCTPRCSLSSQRPVRSPAAA